MGELKSCLFCGKSVDVAFEYCPHCGYEFGEGEDLPGLLEETTSECAAAGDEDYLHRLRALQEVLADMERELDLILALPRYPAELEDRKADPMTSSKGP